MLQTDIPHPILDFFGSSHRVYYIATGEFIQQSAGLRVPFHLCHILNELGFEAYVTAQKQAPNLRTPLLTLDIISKHKADGREIVAVYTEAMWGNILKGDIVVHWIMNSAGLIKEKIVGADELKFFWDESYSLSDKMNLKLLRFPIVDESIYNTIGVNDSRRNCFAYYAHKYLFSDDGVIIPDEMTSNGVSLCQDIPRTPQEIADILRSVKIFYTYEDTALIPEAALCGCVIVFLKTDFTLYACGNSNPEDMYDYCVNEEEFDANASYEYVGVVFNNYRARFIDAAAENLTDFVNITQAVPLRQATPDLLPDFHTEDNVRVFLYGAGRIGHMFYNYLKAVNVKVESFIVADKYISNYNNTFLGIPIHTFSWYKERCDKDCILILTMERKNEEDEFSALDMRGDGCVRYRDAFNFRSCFSSVMLNITERFLEEHNGIYIYGDGIHSDILYNTIRVTGANILGFIIPDQYVENSAKSRYGLPVHPFSVFAETIYDKDCGVAISMQYKFILEVINDLCDAGIKYITTVY